MKLGVVPVNFAGSLNVADLAKFVEDLGFESFWLPEHTVVPVNAKTAYPGSDQGGIPEFMAYMVEPFVGLSMAAAVTNRVLLGTCVSLVPEHNPLVLAKRIASLDLISKGRFIFGVGTGWLPEEGDLFKVDFPRRWTQTREALEIMKMLWTQNQTHFDGDYYRFSPIYSFVHPVQQPHPPIVLGGSARYVFKRIVALGDGWMPIRPTPEQIANGRGILNELAIANGRNPKEIVITAYDPPQCPEAIQELKDAGAERVILRLKPPSGPEILGELAKIADRLSDFLNPR
ncbi:LLM class F420-dependent oxidoreductase [SAR202 cluster bacterium AD-804-J14_MRT_500m]|nr:LLM class F420-dependent oxidoreductase [SAR202 cluster bacterium AD-804-J14_MRT_500m]